MSKATKLKSKFDRGTKFKPKTSMSHDIFIHRKLPNVKKPSSLKHLKNWFIKAERSRGDAIREVVAQEFFRFMIPGHPKTRLVIDENNKTFIASQEAKDAMFIDEMSPANLKHGILTGKYSGLGHLCVMAIFMNEIDFKINNIILQQDPIKQTMGFKKLDGGWSFAGLMDSINPLKYKITEKLIAGLPFKGGYFANWFEEQRSNAETTSKILDPAMINEIQFRKEVNEQILKILLMPDKLIEMFVSSYTDNPKLINELTTFLVERKQQMQQAALKNQRFLSYVNSPDAVQLCETFKAESLAFTTTSTHRLIDKEHRESMTESIGTHWSLLKIKASKPDLTEEVIFSAAKSDPLLNPPGEKETTPNRIYDLSTKDFHKVQVQFCSTKILGFFTRTLDDDAKNLAQQIQGAPNDSKRWEIAYKFIHQHPENPFSKYLKKELEAIKPAPSLRS